MKGWSLRAAALTAAIRHRVDLRPTTDVAGTIERITHDARLTPESVWLLACSSVLASIGLDVSSAAVVIGAMLISPLMGPILGVGLGMGVTDRALLQRALRETALAVGVSLAVSALYFLISPLATSTPELIARTRPTLLDVVVATFGGVAGIVAGSRRRPSLALPGAAIATALMPPLCTAGFGLATGSSSFFWGALYLFALNAIFISLSAFVVVRLLKFPHHQEISADARLRERRLVATVAIVAILPSVYFLYETARKLRQNQRVRDFVTREITAPGRAAQQWELVEIDGQTTIKVYVAGHPIEAGAADSIRLRMADYHLAETDLELVQSDISATDLARFQSDVQRDIVRAVSLANAARDSSLLARQAVDSARLTSAASELVSAFPEIVEITYVRRLDLLSKDTAMAHPGFLVKFAAGIPVSARRATMRRATSLLRQRLASPDIVVVER